MDDWFPWVLFADSPIILQVFFSIVLLIVLTSAFSLVVLTMSASHGRRNRRVLARQGHLPEADESEFLWVFLVAALNEEVTIADSVSRLRAANATHKMILVANDGSEDRTGEILEALTGPELSVFTRIPPEARVGKAAALNNAYRLLLDGGLMDRAGYADWPRDRIIVGIVDADGRLDPDTPATMAPHFADQRVGGAQCRVHIYNQTGYLTWAQDIEFSTFGLLFQAGRSTWGTANMGGNGQFNRLSALQDVSDENGPWHDRLTEDQDLGVRLVKNGWKGRQENSAGIHQQGLSSLRRLYLQRVRWAQGAWQAIALLPGAVKSPIPIIAIIDLTYYLLTPLLQLLTGLALLAAVSLFVFTDAGFFNASGLTLIFFLSIGFLPGLLALLHRGRGKRGLLLVLVGSLPYLIYSWMLIPVLLHSLLRQAFGYTSWTKTAREKIEDGHALEDHALEIEETFTDL